MASMAKLLQTQFHSGEYIMFVVWAVQIVMLWATCQLRRNRDKLKRLAEEQQCIQSIQLARNLSREAHHQREQQLQEEVDQLANDRDEALALVGAERRRVDDPPV